MQRDFLDEDGRRVLDRAAELTADGEGEHRALLMALVDEPRVRSVLVSAFIGAREELLDLEPGVALEGLIRLAYEQAREQGRMIAGPEQLLIALVRTSPVPVDLARRGLRPEALIQSSEWARPEPVPRAVWLCVLLLFGQAFCCACPTGVPVLGALQYSNWMLLPLAADTLWTLGAAFLMAMFLLGASREAWAAACAFQMARTVTILAVGAYGSAAHWESGGALVALAAVPTGLTAWGLFRARSWFRVPERQKWRTLWRKGGWALGITLGLDIALLTVSFLSGDGR